MEERKITKLKHFQNITCPEARRMLDYKICRSDKKNIPTTKKSCYLWNKRNHKTQVGCPACKWNESADSGDENCHRSSYWKNSPKTQTPELQQTKRDRQSQTGRARGPPLLRWFLSLGHYKLHPKGKLKGPPPTWRPGTWYKIGKNRTRNTPRKGRFKPMESEVFICQTGKIQMNTKIKNQEAHSKCPQEQSPI